MSFESDLESLGIDSAEGPKEGSFTPPETPQGDGTQASSLMQTMRGGAPEDQAPSAGPRKLPLQTILTFALLVVGAGVLWGMRQYAINNGMKGASAQQLTITGDHDIKPLSPQQERVLADLKKHAIDEGVVGEDIEQNPFELGGTEKVVAVEPRKDPNAAIAAARREVKQVFDGLAAKSIMMGRVPLVKINDDIFKTGQTVAGIFEIAEIKEGGVTLRVVNKRDGVDGEEHFLPLER